MRNSNPAIALVTDTFISSLRRACGAARRARQGALNTMRLLITVAFALAPVMAVAACLTYEREAALTGVVHLRSAPDGAGRVPILDLNAAVCIEGQGSDRIYVRREGVTSVQLVLPPELTTKVAENRRVTILGTLSGRVTGNPRVPVLLRVRALQNAP